jgi:hypothetical protein
MENAFWNALKEIAVSKNTSRSKLVEMIDKTRSHPNARPGKQPHGPPMTLGNMRELCAGSTKTNLLFLPPAPERIRTSG